jgi:hypothetical protein
MKAGKTKGKVLADLESVDRDHYYSLIETRAEKEVEAKKQSHLQKINYLNQRKAEIQTEKGKNGNPLATVIREELGRVRFTSVLLTICIIGEYIFARWCIEPFGLGFIETYLVAAAIVIMLLKGVDLFLLWLKEVGLTLHKKANVALACAGVVLIFLLVYLISEIRGLLFQTTSVLSGAGIEERAKQGVDFYNHASRTFMWLMAVLTSSIVIIGGLSFHQIKQNFFRMLQLRRMDKEEKNLDYEILVENQRVVLENTQLQAFMEDVEAGLHMELARQNRRKKTIMYRLMERLFECLKPNVTGARVAAFSIAALIFVTCVFFFTALAKGETIAYLDLSRSVEVTDYAGGDTEFQHNFKGVQALIENIPRGEPFKVFGITERTFSQPWLLLEGMITTDKGYFGEREAQQRLALIRKWKERSLRPVADATDIFGAAHLAASLFNGNRNRKNLVFFSDMRQNTQELNLEKYSVIDPEAVMRELIQRTPIPSLNNVRVWCLGVHSAGKTPAYWYSLRAFWEKYFQLAKISGLQAFSIEHKVSFEGF